MRGSEQLGILDPGVQVSTHRHVRGRVLHSMEDEGVHRRETSIYWMSPVRPELCSVVSYIPSYLNLMIIDEVAVILSFLLTSEGVEIQKAGPCWILSPLLSCFPPLFPLAPSITLPGGEQAQVFLRYSPI